jgi:hypothetical protein
MTNRLSEDVTSDKVEAVCALELEGNVSQELLWLRHRDSSGTHEGARPPLETVTKGLVKGYQAEKTLSACYSELSRM